MSALGDAVRAERERHGMTLAEVGKSAGVVRGHIHDIETGRRLPSFEVCEAIARTLGISDLPMRGFLVSEKTKRWAMATPEVGRLLDALAHFDGDAADVECLMDHFARRAADS